MIQYLMVYGRDGSYKQNSDAEVEDREELLDALEGEPD